MPRHFDFLRYEILESRINDVRVEDAFRKRLLLCIEIINRNRRSPRRDINQAVVRFPIRTTATEGSARRQLDLVSLPRGEIISQQAPDHAVGVNHQNVMLALCD